MRSNEESRRRVAVLLLNAGRGSGEVARQQARYLAASGWRVFFMHPGIGEGAPGAINREVRLHTSVIPVHEHLPSAGRSQEQVARMSYARAMSYLRDYERALESVIADVDMFARFRYRRFAKGKSPLPATDSACSKTAVLS